MFKYAAWKRDWGMLTLVWTSMIDAGELHCDVTKWTPTAKDDLLLLLHEVVIPYAKEKGLTKLMSLGEKDNKLLPKFGRLMGFDSGYVMIEGHGELPYVYKEL